MKEQWVLTLKGLIADDVYDKILLYMYKNKYNGIALEDDVLTFVTLERKPIKKRGKK